MPFDGWNIGDKLVWTADKQGTVYTIEDIRGGQIRVRWGEGNNHYTYSAQGFRKMAGNITPLKDLPRCPNCEERTVLDGDYLCRGCRYGLVA